MMSLPARIVSTHRHKKQNAHTHVVMTSDDDDDDVVLE
jgi:hypothetical protein